MARWEFCMSIAHVNGPGHVPLPTEEVPAPCVPAAIQTSPLWLQRAAALQHSFWLSGHCARENRYQNRLYSKELLSQTAGIKLHLGVCCRHVFTEHTTTQIFLHVGDSQENCSTSSNLSSHVIQAKEGLIIPCSPNLFRSKGLSLANQCQRPSTVKTKKQTNPKPQQTRWAIYYQLNVFQTYSGAEIYAEEKRTAVFGKLKML